MYSIQQLSKKQHHPLTYIYSMKHLILCCLLFPFAVVAQTPANHSKAKTTAHTKPTPTKKFPFNKAAYTLLISFEPLNTDPMIWDTVAKRFVNKPNLPFPDTLGYVDVHEIKLLSAAGFQQLYHTLHTHISTRQTGYGCYWPRNAILFRDSTHNTIARLDICFECEGSEAWPDKYQPDVENNDYDVIKKIFIDNGIKYGTVEN